jgi:hypothetical protein
MLSEAQEGLKGGIDASATHVGPLRSPVLRPQNERVLFHYNGHGVPRPTVNGEIWVFNSRYTQYIPLSIYELQSWLGTPSIYVLDCSAAGLIINAFRALMDQRQQDLRMVRRDIGGLEREQGGRELDSMAFGAPPLSSPDAQNPACCHRACRLARLPVRPTGRQAPTLSRR